MLVFLCSDGERPSSLSRQNSAASTSGATGPAAASEAGPHSLNTTKILDERERRTNSIAILRILCEHSLIGPFLVELLTAK